ncbi:uncharacterized protein METZ01_LOCUS307328, partial [marine metagenome]
NDAPVVDATASQTIDEDSSLTLTLSASDVDGDDLTFSASADNASTSVDGSTLTVTPEADFNGELEVTVFADDGNGGLGSNSFVLTVTPVNDAPVVNAIDPQTVAEDSSLTLELFASDVDEDDITFGVYVDSGSATVDGSMLTVIPDQDFNGNIEVTVSANDGTLSGTTSFTLTVTSVNDAPLITSISDQGIDEDSSLTLTLSASDVDGDELTFSASNGNAEITVNGSTLTVVPAEDYNGDATITVNVTDGEYTDTTEFTLTINPVNDAPVLGDISDDSVAEDSSLIVDLSASDVDGDNLTFSASSSSGSATVDGSTLTVSPAQDFNGDVEVTVTASDGSLTDSGSFTLTVTSVNDAPVVDATASQTIDEDSSLTL